MLFVLHSQWIPRVARNDCLVCYPMKDKVSTRPTYNKARRELEHREPIDADIESNNFVRIRLIRYISVLNHSEIPTPKSVY